MGGFQIEILNADHPSLYNFRLSTLLERKWRTQITSGRVDAVQISDRQRDC